VITTHIIAYPRGFGKGRNPFLRIFSATVTDSLKALKGKSSRSVGFRVIGLQRGVP